MTKHRIKRPNFLYIDSQHPWHKTQQVKREQLMGRTLPPSKPCVHGLAVGLAKVSWTEKTPGFRTNSQDAPKCHGDA